MKALLATAAALGIFHWLLRCGGAAEHTSVIAGQPLSSASFLLGPAYVLSYLAFVVVVPICLLAAIFEAIARRGRSVADR